MKILSLLLALLLPSAAHACGTITAKLWHETGQAAARYGLEQELLAALVWQESRFCPSILGPVTRFGTRAVGLGQLLPSTAASLGVDPFDPRQNLDGAARYLLAQYQSFGSWPLALAAYNAGPGAVREHGGIPPSRETQAYVPSILAKYQELKQTPPFSLVETVPEPQANDSIIVSSSLAIFDHQRPRSLFSGNR